MTTPNGLDESRPVSRRLLEPTRPGQPARRLEIDALLSDPETQIIVCCGAGGVGKTTTAAALALRAAEAGRKVAVLTIDPARRLAQSMGLTELDNSPRAVPGIDATKSGRLDAMMLDMKRTFDEVVRAHSSPDKAEQILDNPFYQALSSSFAGTQEYMAMEKLGQLYLERDQGGERSWDLIIVDTPPSRSALDFLDAPKRLGSFLDGRFIRLLLAPAKAGGRAYLKVISTGVSLASAAMSKILGSQMLTDVQNLVAALDTMFGGFRERADQTYALLRQRGTAFVVVASPERDALREAGYFIDRLAADGMPLAGLIVNRMLSSQAPALQPDSALSAAEALAAARSATAGSAAEGLAVEGSATEGSTPADSPLEGILRVHADQGAIAHRHQMLVRRFLDAHPGVAVVHVPAAAQDIHDLQALRDIGAALSCG